MAELIWTVNEKLSTGDNLSLSCVALSVENLSCVKEHKQSSS